ncbi:MAG: hypothetical protein KDD44_02510 [Bdellovibrionales bacterium]|nr:hypothetical protein [Bdellovibrionales bacterium]
MKKACAPFSMLLAVDPSLTSSGWALFNVSSGQPCAAGVIRPPGPRHAMALRLAELQQEVHSLFIDRQLGVGDVVVCEGPAPLVRNPSSAVKVEQVRSIFETIARASGAVVPGRLNPRTVQTELLGMRGRQLPRAEVKRWARDTVQQLFGRALTALEIIGDTGGTAAALSQDIVDALLIGAVAVSRVQLSLSGSQPLETAFSGYQRSNRNGVVGVRWTEADLRNVNSSVRYRQK